MVDPCSTTVINPWSIAPRTVRNGETDIYEFNEATDSIQVANNVSTLCGPREYTVLNADGTAPTGSWTAVAVKTGTSYPSGVYKITSNPMLENLEQLHNLKLKIVLTNYKGAPVNHAGIEIAFTVTVNSAVCECNRITWDPPAAQTLTTTVKKIPPATLTISHATMNEASKTAVPQTRKCGNSCLTSTSILSIV